MKTLLIITWIGTASFGQTISSDIPENINRSEKYLFYLHGGVVTELGDNAVNRSVPEWGLEATDPHGTCVKLFENRKHISGYEEITLHTGLSHGFIYKGQKEWIDPILNWYEMNE